MTKKDWLWVLLPLFLVPFIDQASKYWALDTLEFKSLDFGFFGFALHKNPGAMLGTFSNLSPLMRFVTFATGGGFVLFIYSVIQYFLPDKIYRLRVGMSFLVGGILGNVIDRILYGPVTDFIFFGSKNGWHSPIFNIADALQWVGYGLVVYFLLVESDKLWPKDDQRKRLWVDPKYQLKYSMILASVTFWFSLIMGIYSFTFLRVMMENAGMKDQQEAQSILFSFVSIFALLTVTFMISIFLIGRILSHRTVGPLRGFQNFIKDIRQGRDRPLRLRKNDELKYLETLGSILRKDYQKIFKKMRHDQLNKEQRSKMIKSVKEAQSSNKNKKDVA